jgi:importin subunit beta-1
MAIEDAFVPYLNVVMQVLHGASGLEITNDTDDDMVEYINTLRESILEAYTGIVQVRLHNKFCLDA